MKASKKLIGASVALVAALAVSVGTTYAWFTTNQKVTVSNISATVTTGDSNLEVRLMTLTNGDGKIYADYADESSWGYSLDLSGVYDDVVLDHATSKNEDNGSSLLGKDFKAAKAGSYIEIPLALRTPAKSNNDVTIVLSTSSKVESDGNTDAQNIRGWKADEGYGNGGIALGEKIAAKAQDAMRLAFIPFTTEVNEDSASQTSEFTATMEDSVGVWEPNATSGFTGKGTKTGNVLSHDVELYLAGKYNAETDTMASDSTIDSYYDTETYGTYDAVTPGTSTIVTIAGNSDVQYCYSFVLVKIWVEGTDGDCLNNIFGDTIQITLGFEIQGAQNNG